MIHTLKKILPQSLKSLAKGLIAENRVLQNICFIEPVNSQESIGWRGNYSSWAEAEKNSGGYAQDEILEKVRVASLKVKNGEAIYERDSVLFDRIEYSWPLLSALLWVAAQNQGCLDVLDFGGALGSTYYQNKKFLSGLKKVKWQVVEQENFVNIGKKEFADGILDFFYSLEEAQLINRAKVIILSSVLAYLENPYGLIDEIQKLEIPYIVVDLTGFVDSTSDLLTVQNVPKSIYKASYPCWFLSKTHFLEKMDKNYEVIEEFKGYIGSTIELKDKTKAGYKGFIFKRKKHS